MGEAKVRRLPVIDDFIEMGLDVLDPIQPLAEGMDAANYTVDVVLIKPGWSANGRYYGRELLELVASARQTTVDARVTPTGGPGHRS